MFSKIQDIEYHYTKDSKVEVCGGGGIDRHSTQESCRWGGRGGGVDQHSTQESCRWAGRGGRGVNRHTPWKGSVKTLQGLPDSVDPGGGGLINTPLRKDLQRHCKDYL